jgi:predicted transposase/invertase (TIGR01784 family)
MMILDIDPKVDYAFKRVYGREENIDVLKSILEAVLEGTEFGTITELEVVNPFNERDTFDDKLSIEDVRARQKSGEVFNVEMQLLPNKALPQRLLYYWSVSHAGQLVKGNAYSELKPTIVICFTDFVEFPEDSNCHSRFRVMNQQSRVFCHDLEIHLLEIPKFQADEKAVATPLDQWLFFLREAQNLDSDHRPSCLTLPTIHKAIEELQMINLNEADHELYQDRLKASRDERFRRNDTLAEGAMIGRIQSLESFLGREETPFEQLDKKRWIELKQLEADLKAELANRS